MPHFLIQSTLPTNPYKSTLTTLSIPDCSSIIGDSCLPHHSHAIPLATTAVAERERDPIAVMNILFSVLILFLSLSSQTHFATAGGQKKPKNPSQDLVQSSCVHASYPNICLRTLSCYAGPASTPRDLAQAAVKVSLSRARKASSSLATLRYRGKKEEAAVRDCVEQVADSVEELSKTLSELQHLRSGTFRWQMSNAETWVSAALTNEDTCLDGFREVEGEVRSDVKRKIKNVAKVTSNALYLINRLDQTRG